MTIELLMQAGSIVYSPDNNEMTPLHLAALYNNIPTAAALIRNSADPMSLTSTQWTPRRVAQKYGHAEIDSFLVAKGATR
jgi:ankyrin repeat protein